MKKKIIIATMLLFCASCGVSKDNSLNHNLDSATWSHVSNQKIQQLEGAIDDNNISELEKRVIPIEVSASNDMPLEAENLFN